MIELRLDDRKRRELQAIDDRIFVRAVEDKRAQEKRERERQAAEARARDGTAQNPRAEYRRAEPAAEEAGAWAIRELRRFRDAGDEKLTRRYERLVRYFAANGFGSSEN